MAGEGSNSNFAPPSIPKFDGDYDHWSMLMENLLRSKEYWSLVETGYTEPAEGEVMTAAQRKTLEELKLKDFKVKNYLFQSIDKSILKTIIQKDTSKHLWDSMKRKYQGNKRVQRSQLQTLRREFEILEMKSGESVTDYFSRVMMVANDMRNYGENMQDVKIVEKILRTLTDKFNYIVCSIEESKDIDHLSVDELQSSLLVHEQKFRKGNSDEQVLKVTSVERLGPNREEDGFEGRGRGRGVFRSRGRGRGRQSFNKAVVECFKCHKLGHFQYECPSWEKRVNYAELEEEDELLLMAHVERNDSKPEDVWFLDSGCSNHMCCNKDWFTNIDEEFRHSVKLGNNARMSVMGKGSIRLKVDGLTQVISDVYFVPELRNNLLSIGQLQEKGLAILIQHGVCKIYHSKKGLIMQTPMTANRMFVLLANVVVTDFSTCMQASSDDLSHLWHCRYSHLNYKGLKTLHYRKMVKGLPQIKASARVCHDCLVGKQSRDSIPKSSQWRASQRLQLVHADICGPITPTSNSDKRYVLSFIDDFSRKMWVYFLTEKSQAFTMFKRYKSLVEKEIGFPICCLRTDRGGEFTSNEFNEFCQSNGIKRQLTAAYTPQQNGVAERRNRTVMNLVRSILSEKKIPKSFWPEAVNWVTHVLNRSPTQAVQDVTPEEAWSGVKPNVGYFRVFGCVAHVHIPDAKRTKLDDKSCKCVLLGVSEETKGYRLYNPQQRGLL
ncbi:putative RNA-directed DNA polymerase [Rosa chinensis]|uniref:Putative RNA-directed DNA polymerase n=1 Tax=Rosa chinensis TaxID=74649 RepID=A0A2P6QV05_ROSCH|nr:putative RNA-directed DNA polymerase [Rosa chinensis]